MTLAIIFDSVGVGEWFVLLAVLLIVVGPRRLPATARKFGQYYAKFRRAAEGFKRQLMEMDAEITSTVEKTERDISSVADEVVGSENYEDYGVGPEDFETDYDTGETPPAPGPSSESAGAPVASTSAAPAAAPARDLAAVKISVSPAPGGKTGHVD